MAKKVIDRKSNVFVSNCTTAMGNLAGCTSFISLTRDDDGDTEMLYHMNNRTELICLTTYLEKLVEDLKQRINDEIHFEKASKQANDINYIG